MSIFDENPLNDLDRKVLRVFGEHAVVKSLAAGSSFARLPRFVSEYLIAKYVKPETWRDDLAKVQAKVRELLPELEQRELLKERLLRTGEAVLIDLVEARVDLRNGRRWARVPALNDDKVRVPPHVIEQHPGLLLGGLWGTVKLKYAPAEDEDAPNEVAAFTPFQVGPPNLADFRKGRGEFDTDEWLTVLLQSAGYSAAAFPDRRTKLLLLSRLVPLVERNVNVVELGPRQTGKTFLLRNVSPRVFTISGGRTTPANLFVNLATRAVGILGTRKVVVFDEIAHTTFEDADATVSTLKDFMESGQFSRGSKSYAADAGLVFAGNLDVDGTRPDAKYRHLFEPLPEELIDAAFLDRMHGYLPGWEVPKITPGSLATGVGLVTDYFGEVLVRMRDDDVSDRFRRMDYADGLTKRDLTAVTRLASGMFKLLHPDGKATDEETRAVALLACEYRQRVHDQLSRIAPGEFKARVIAPRGVERHEAADLQPRIEAPPPDDRLNREAVVGAVTGLSVITRDGVDVDGELMLVQVSGVPGRAGVEVTGMHGSVLRDSVQTAYNIVRSRFRELGVDEGRLKKQKVAVHLVKIATPREGPSAGTAFVTGIVSALTGRPVKPGVAMTGEVALHGQVTAVGGIEQKVRAAAEAGRRIVIIPSENAAQAQALPDEVLDRVELVPVKTIEEVIENALEPEGGGFTPAAEAPAGN